MTSKSETGKLPATLLTVLLACLVTACDGGMFGTDDGGVDAAPAASEPLQTDFPAELATTDSASTGQAPTGAMETTGTGNGLGMDTTELTDASVIDTASTDGMLVMPDAPQALTMPDTFSNTLLTTLRDDALLTVVNPLDRNLSLVTSGASSTQMNTLVIAAGSASAYLPLRAGMTEVRLIDGRATDAAAAVVSLELNLGVGTMTTLIARDTGTLLEIIPLASESGSFDATLAGVRLAQAADLGDPQGPASLRLESRGAGGGGVEAEFAGLSISSPATDYQYIPGGDYTLIDSAGRFTEQAVSFAGGQTYTLIIRAPTGQVLQIEQDSVIDVR